jgi:hypothetical protein
MEEGDRHGIHRQALAAITLAEIYYGIEKSPGKRKNADPKSSRFTQSWKSILIQSDLAG